MDPDASFSVAMETDERLGQTLLVGISHVGMAGLTAADYLVRHLDSELVGHVSPEGFPALAPFENGEPRHPIRLYNLTGTDLTVLVGELFVPVWAASSFADVLLEWVDEFGGEAHDDEEHGVGEIAILHGVPFPHGPEEHAVFSVATPDYRERRLADGGVPPLGGGFLDGVAGEIVTGALEGRAPPVGVYVTPTHPPGPDVDAALMLLDAIEGVYGVTVDEAELRRLSEELKRHYAGLADRLKSLGESDQSVASRDYPEDRMYM